MTQKEAQEKLTRVGQLTLGCSEEEVMVKEICTPKLQVKFGVDGSCSVMGHKFRPASGTDLEGLDMPAGTLVTEDRSLELYLCPPSSHYNPDKWALCEIIYSEPDRMQVREWLLSVDEYN